MRETPERLLRGLFDAALDAVSPARCVPPHLPPRPAGRTVVVGAGKAAAAMAAAVERHWTGELSGVVVVPYGHAVACRRVAVIEAAHPLPDEAGMAAARAVLDAVRSLAPDDLVLALISGGGSALLALPAPGITLADKQAVTRALLGCGASIGEINAVRKPLSAIKGGRLAAAARPARLATLVISDVPGDDPATVASGPTLPNVATIEDARKILVRYGIAPPRAVAALLARGGEALSPDRAAFAADHVAVVARARDGLAAAAALAERSGLACGMLGDAIEGEAREVGRAHATLAAASGNRGRLLLSGGETTVTLSAAGGAGGRNTEYLLSLAIALKGRHRLWALACDTDGIDGNGDAAGAILRPDSLARARDRGIDPGAMLEQHRSGEFFAALGDLIRTGPTCTNVNDFRAILVDPGGGPPTPRAGTGAAVDL